MQYVIMYSDVYIVFCAWNFLCSHRGILCHSPVPYGFGVKPYAGSFLGFT